MRALLLCCLLLSPVVPGAEPTEPPQTEIEDLLNAIDLTGWDQFFSGLEDTEPWQRPSLLIKRLAEGKTSGGAELLGWLKDQAVKGLSGAQALLLLALATGVLSALCTILLETGALPARRVLAIGLSAAVLLRLVPLIHRGMACMQGIAALGERTVPLMTASLLLLGSPQGAAAMGTAGELLLFSCLRWMEDILLPLVISAGVLKTADLMGDGVLSSVSRLLFSLVRWGVRALCIGYMLVAALLGGGASAMDTLLLRTGRVAAGSVPLVGSVLSDSLGTAVACLGLVKRALGWTGMLLVLFQAAGPAVTLLLYGFSLRASSSLLQPLEQPEMGTVLSALGEMLTELGALVLAAGAMLCVAVGGVAGCLGGGQ